MIRIGKRSITFVILILLAVIAVALWIRACSIVEEYYKFPMPHDSDEIAHLNSSIASATDDYMKNLDSDASEPADNIVATISSSVVGSTGAEIQDDLKLFEQASRRYPMALNPDFWLLREYTARRDWNSCLKTLRSALFRPQHNHIRHAFSCLAAQVELILWLRQPSSTHTQAYLNEISKTAGAVPENWVNGTLIVGKGFFAKNALASEEMKLTSEIPNAEDLNRIFENNMTIIASNPESLSKYIKSLRAKCRKRCAVVLNLVNKNVRHPQINEEYAAVDFMYESLRSISKLNNRSPIIAGKRWLEFITAEWNVVAVPFCYGNRYERMRNNWGCIEHEIFDANGTQNLSGADFAIAEAWAEFLFTHPLSKPEAFSPAEEL